MAVFLRRIITCFSLCVLVISCEYATTNKSELDERQILNTISDRLYAGIVELDTSRLPRSVEGGKVRFTSPGSWTSGFFPGILWMMASYEPTKKWSDKARKYTELLENVKYETGHHDLGFMLYNSYGRGYSATNNPAYREVLFTGAASLASRYDTLMGAIKSWDRPGKWQYPVIIDNMINLEFLLWVSKESGDSTYMDIAISHADETLKNHFRPDYSSYHVVDYDTVTGEPVWRGTHQGLSDSSDWARGQAWGLYGYTMMYRETGHVRYLNQAKSIAQYLLDHSNMPEDLIPYWDLKDPEIPNTHRDVSAAAIIASALLELSDYVKDNQQLTYLTAGRKILTNLDRLYTYENDDIRLFYLDQSVGSKPKNGEVGVPVIYADYYFVEALMRSLERQ
ncbi:glucuronyl hydrolase [Fulvivirga sp. M361]|uniref:glycoside hydrolase family 88 protein n=1 Tax=Fulvivirga sp. M361 TaxID=2594266 RepID=UPI00117AA223|nr:glycoside hydrolase family 88 protein [Fulvivirga sp. M361]TRX61206.1 glucuronyl hydrolase [Fulvivirga sp. M361]